MNPTTMKTNPTLKIDDQYIEQIPLSKIVIDRNWNVRKYLGDDSEGGPEEHSFSDLMESIASEGQDTPVRIKKGGTDELKSFFLIEGFRRSAAIMKLHAAGRMIPGLKDGCIKAIVENTMTELEALVRNGRENTARANLNMADTAYLVARLAKEGLTEAHIAVKLALSQSYVNQLRTVNKGLADLNITLKDGRNINAFEHWREAPGRIAFQTLLELCRLRIDPRLKELKYVELLTSKEKNEDGSSKEKKEVKKNEFSLSETFGAMLGRLASKGLVTVNEDWERLLFIGKRIKLEGQSTEYKARIVSCAKEGFDRGLSGK